MKRALILCATGLLLLASIPSFAQAAAGGTGSTTGGAAATASTTGTSGDNPKDAYCKVVTLVKVWTHQLGYRVQFLSSKGTINDIYVPRTWFNVGTNSKADIVYGMERGYPYMAIFWVDGKFDHLRLYVLSDVNSQSWGVLSQDKDFSSQFKVQDIPLDF